MKRDVPTGDLRCPRCDGVLNYVPDRAMCVTCGNSWDVREGILDFRTVEPYLYDYEYTPSTSRELIANANSLGWRRALRQAHTRFGEEWDEYFYHYNESEERAPWADWLLRSAEQPIVLDFGCGLGAITVVLARLGAQVLACDASFERAQFTRIRTQQESLDRVTVFCWDGTGDAPIPHDSVDVVLLNGVLEWVPESIRAANPWSAQLSVLRALHKVLKPGGRLFLAIENRVALRYLLGTPDHHSELRFATLLPRPLASLYSSIVNKRPYRVWTYTLRGYKRLLRDAGYDGVEAYEAFPQYQYPRRLILLTDAQQLLEIHSAQTGVEQRLLCILAKLGLAPYFVFTYAFVAAKQ